MVFAGQGRDLESLGIAHARVDRSHAGCRRVRAGTPVSRSATAACESSASSGGSPMATCGPATTSRRRCAATSKAGMPSATGGLSCEELLGAVLESLGLNVTNGYRLESRTVRLRLVELRAGAAAVPARPRTPKRRGVHRLPWSGRCHSAGDALASGLLRPALRRTKPFRLHSEELTGQTDRDEAQRRQAAFQEDLPRRERRSPRRWHRHPQRDDDDGGRRRHRCAEGGRDGEHAASAVQLPAARGASRATRRPPVRGADRCTQHPQPRRALLRAPGGDHRRPASAALPGAGQRRPSAVALLNAEVLRLAFAAVARDPPGVRGPVATCTGSSAVRKVSRRVRHVACSIFVRLTPRARRDGATLVGPGRARQAAGRAAR